MRHVALQWYLHKDAACHRGSCNCSALLSVGNSAVQQHGDVDWICQQQIDVRQAHKQQKPQPAGMPGSSSTIGRYTRATQAKHACKCGNMHVASINVGLQTVGSMPAGCRLADEHCCMCPFSRCRSSAQTSHVARLLDTAQRMLQ